MRKHNSQVQYLSSPRQSRLVSFLMVLFSVAIATFLALTLVAMAHGQTRSNAPLHVQYAQIDAAQFPTVVSYVSVTDSTDVTVGGLREEHFTAREDSVRELPMLVEEIGANAEGVTVALALDRSGSMEEEMPDAQNAAMTFVRLMRAKDQAALVSFASEVRTDQTFTSDSTQLLLAIRALVAQGGTAINDAAIYCADLLQNVAGRRAIILLTDGLDKDSQATLEQAVQRFTGLGIPIFIIGLGSEVSETNLRILAQSSGGRYYFSPTSKQLEEIYKTIAALLHHSYRITYTTHNPTTDGTLRHVRLDVSARGTHAFAYNNYRAPEHVPTLMPVTLQSPEPGDDLQVTVEIPSAGAFAYNLADLQFALVYNTRHVRVKTPANANVLALTFFGAPSDFSFTANVDSLNGKIFLRFKRNANLPPAEGYGAVAQINFQTLFNVPDTSGLNFSLNNIVARDKNNWPVAVKTERLNVPSAGVLVWPGDTNNNGVVELTDVTALGLHWESIGPKRLGAENQNAWQPHAAKKFAKAQATHVDANGSGKIDERDLFPIGLNWRKTRGTSAASKIKHAAAPEGGVHLAITPSGEQTYRLQIIFQNINDADLAGIAFRMNYARAHASIISIQAGKAWSRTPLWLQQDDRGTHTLAVSAMLPAGELTRASEGSLVEILINAAEPPLQENFMFNEFVVLSPSGEMRELEVQIAEAERGSVIPRELILHPAYPNPFRLDDAAAMPTGMKIQYDLPENAAVSVAIYNTTGQRVRLISAVLDKGGRHYLHWEGFNDLGRTVSSGIYLVKIEAAGESGRAYQATQKVTVVR